MDETRFFLPPQKCIYGSQLTIRRTIIHPIQPIPSMALLSSARGFSKPSMCKLWRYTRTPLKPVAHYNHSIPIGAQLRGSRPNPIYPARGLTSSSNRGVERSTHGKQGIKQQDANQSATKVAEAREAALRAARLRRSAETETEAKLKSVEKKAYDKRYKTAARKWVSGMIALPILLVTSYYLFDRRKYSQSPW